MISLKKSRMKENLGEEKNLIIVNLKNIAAFQKCLTITNLQTHLENMPCVVL